MSTNSELKRLKGSKTWTELAKELGITRQTINNWRKSGSSKALDMFKRIKGLRDEQANASTAAIKNPSA